MRQHRDIVLSSIIDLQDLEEEIRKKIDQVAHAQTSATKFLQEELENKSQVRNHNIFMKLSKP